MQHHHHNRSSLILEQLLFVKIQHTSVTAMMCISIRYQSKLPPCKYRDFGLAVIKHILTTVGGSEVGWQNNVKPTNILFSSVANSWKKIYPPMPTKRWKTAIANTPSHLVVAGGLSTTTVYDFDTPGQSTVEVLNTETLQWFTACSLPGVGFCPQLSMACSIRQFSLCLQQEFLQ